LSNHAVVSIGSDVDVSVTYHLNSINNVENEQITPDFEYIGELFIKAGTAIDVDLREFFESFRYVQIKCFKISVDYQGITEELSAAFSVFYGNIPNRVLKDVADIFTEKLMNAEKAFILTSRTEEKTIFVPENELMPFFSYASSVYFEIFAENDFENSLFENEHDNDRVISFDLQQLRKAYFLQQKQIKSVFKLLDSERDLLYKIVITEAQPTDYFLRFLNSWGVFEKIALYGFMDYKPTFEEDESYLKYNRDYKIFDKQLQRKTVTHIYSASTGTRPLRDRIFLIDLLVSDEVYIEAHGKEFPCKVIGDSEIYDTTAADTIALDLTIELLDKDKSVLLLNFKPEEYENLQDIESEQITDINSNNIKVKK
jgi:hypothetical protein